jgi:hypothetical protein
MTKIRRKLRTNADFVKEWQLPKDREKLVARLGPS